MFDGIDPIYIYFSAIGGLALVVAETIYGLTSTASGYRANVNRRLGRISAADDRQAVIVDIRRERGLGDIGGAAAQATWLRTLLVQSGLALSPQRIVAIAAGAAVAGLVAGYLTYGAIGAPIGGLLGGGVAPIMALRRLRNRRRDKFTEQFPEALDIIVRSLRAGHPVPAALRIVAREMSDPIGSEFGMVEDELVYGLDIEAAMRNMLARVGQEDLPLFVTSVAIQANTGGNLAEILANLTEVVRSRIRMRRKIRAVSAESRISAIILSAAPVIVFMALNWLTPDFYGAHWTHPWMAWGLGGAATWMALGNLIMRRMVNFKV